MADEEEMMSADIRLGCLRAALDLRTPASTASDILARAEEFYRFVTAFDGGTGSAEFISVTRQSRSGRIERGS
jgi:hypothetical protein